MKTSITISLKLFFCGLMIFLTSCSQESALMEDPIPQLEAAVCADLSTNDLDLSEGFKGTVRKGVTPDDPDFSLLNTDTSYPFPPPAEAGDCTGFCALTVEFEAAPGVENLDMSAMALQTLSLTYWDNGVEIQDDVQAYTWSPPELIIQDLLTNVLVDYNITFTNNDGTLLEVASVEVSGGLCIVENVNIIDPTKRVKVLNGNEHND